MNTSDLDINNYSSKDLFDLFELERGKNYDDSILNTKFDKLSSRILSDNRIDYSQKMELIDFLKKGLNKLIYETETYEQDYKLTDGNFMPNLERNVVYPNKHFVIKQNKKKGLTGLINPLVKAKMTKLLNINTLFRKDYYNSSSTDFVFELPNTLNNVISLALETAEIANTSNTLSSKLKNNEFTIELVDADGNGTVTNRKRKTIIIQDGSYTGEALVDYLNTRVFDTDPDLRRCACMYNENNKKINFFTDPIFVTDISDGVVNANLSYKFNLDFNLADKSNRSIQMNLGWILGYRKQYYRYDDHYVQSDKTTPNISEGFNPEAPFKRKPNKYIYLSVDAFNNNHSQVILSPFEASAFNDTNILAKLMNNYGDNFNYMSGSFALGFTRNYFGPVNIRRLKIRLLDEMGRVLDLNNADYSLTLSVNQIYDLNRKE